MFYMTYSFYKVLTLILVLIVSLNMYVVFMASASGSVKFYHFYSRFVDATHNNGLPLGGMSASISLSFLWNSLAGWIFHPAVKHQDRSRVSLRLVYQPVITTLNCWEKSVPIQNSFSNCFCDLFSSTFSQQYFFSDIAL
jgi:hypothetical protein